MTMATAIQRADLEFNAILSRTQLAGRVPIHTNVVTVLTIAEHAPFLANSG